MYELAPQVPLLITKMSSRYYNLIFNLQMSVVVSFVPSVFSSFGSEGALRINVCCCRKKAKKTCVV